MNHLLKSFLYFLLRLGMPGIFCLSLLDSTFLFFMPFAIDWLLIILVSNHKSLAPLYVLVTVVGSLTGCLITYYIVSKTSEQTFDKHFSSRRIKRAKEKMKEKGFETLLVAALLPPPFPFTPFTVTASAIELPIKQLTGSVLIGRTIRFAGEAILAYFIGKRILKLLDAPPFQAAMLGLFALCLIGSIVTILRWARRK